MSSLIKQAWKQRKEEIDEALDKTLKLGNVDKETLKLMKELLKTTRIECSITNYYDDEKLE